MNVTAVAIFQGRNVSAPGEFITVGPTNLILAGDRLLNVIRIDTGSDVTSNFGPVATSDGTVHQFQGSLLPLMLLAYFGR